MRVVRISTEIIITIIIMIYFFSRFLFYKNYKFLKVEITYLT